jgi:L-tyrosine isonitrile synthase
MTPNMSFTQSVDTLDTMLTIFDHYRKATAIGVDQYEEKGKASLKARFAGFMSKAQPVSFVFPGYPLKSKNTKTKVLGELPDGAEDVSFRQFAKFVHEMKSVYAPGVEINIVSDGYVFNDLLNIPDRVVAAYEEECMRMVDQTPIKWHTVQSIYNGNTKDSSIVPRLVKEFGQTPEEIYARILSEPDTNMLYKGMLIFWEQDLTFPEGTSKSQRKNQVKALAREIVRLSEAYTSLIRATFKDSIRLSCHPSVNDGTKYSWRFIPGDDTWASPWHNVLCITPDNAYQLRKRFEAESEGMELVYRNERPYFFRHPGTSVDIAA